MKKIYLLASIAMAVVVVGAGCATKTASTDQSASAPTTGNREWGAARGFSFATGTVSDLKVGALAMVQGATNSDGSVNAQRIVLGDLTFDSRTGTRQFATGTSAGNNAAIGDQNRQDGQRQWGGQSGSGRTRAFDGSGGGRGRGGNLRGEILSVAADNFVLKLQDGGSKMVYFSSSTSILIETKSDNPPALGQNAPGQAAPAATSATANQAITMDEVVKHNNDQSCYIAVRGVVYDVTAFIYKHKAGPDSIIKTCGTDATGIFEGKHGGQPGPEQVLSSMQIGVLK